MPDPETTRPGAIPLRERPTLAEEWQSYSDRIVPKDAHEIQRIETKRAFYAGATRMFMVMTEGLDGGDDATELDIQYMDRLHMELIQFQRDVASGAQ